MTPSILSANVTNPNCIRNGLPQYGEVPYRAKDLTTGIRCPSSVPCVLSALELALQSVRAQLVLGCFDWGSSVVKSRTSAARPAGFKARLCCGTAGEPRSRGCSLSSHSCEAAKRLYDIWAHQPRCQVPYGNEFIRPSGRCNHFNRKAAGCGEEGDVNGLEDALENSPKKPKLSCR